MKKLIMCLMAVAILFACKKEAVEGPQGEKGEKGEAGSNGTNGTNGVANIQTINFSVQTWQWTNIGTQGQSGFFRYHERNEAAITQDIFDKGAVLFYWKIGAEWTCMPLTLSNSGASVTYSPSIELSKVYINLFYTNPNQPAPNNSMDIKMVIIPASGKMAASNYDWSKYEKIKHLIE